MAETINKPAWMQWVETLMGGVSRQTVTATLPPDRFHCLLDELPLHLIPLPARELLRFRDERPLFLTPDCIVCAEGDLPEELEPHKQLLSGFALQGTIAWVRNPISKNLLPFWLGPRTESCLAGIKPDDPSPVGLPQKMRAVLSAAGILVSTEHEPSRHRKWQRMVEQSSSLFRQKGYAPLSDLIHPFHIAALRRYYRHLIRTGAIHLGDGQSARRYVAYNEPVARFFHRQIAAALSAVAGEPLTPSYVYMASYLSGAELKKHTDRPQCEFSVTFCLDFSPEPAFATPWPIQLDTPSGTVSVYQSLGDGLAYRGTRLPHYRGVLGEGQTSTSIFFHYVPADFKGSLD